MLGQHRTVTTSIGAGIKRNPIKLNLRGSTVIQSQTTPTFGVTESTPNVDIRTNRDPDSYHDQVNSQGTRLETYVLSWL